MQNGHQIGGATNYQSRGYGDPLDKEVAAAGMMDYVKTVFKKYADFKGRARRSEYWYFTLFNALVIMILYVPALALLVAESNLAFIPLILIGLYGLATIVPTLAVTVRRLHDVGRSGWYYFISLIPFVGGILLLISLIKDSDPGTNDWGPNPKNSLSLDDEFKEDSLS